MNKKHILKAVIYAGCLICTIGLLKIYAMCIGSMNDYITINAWTEGDTAVGQPVKSVKAIFDGTMVKITYDLENDADVWVIASFDEGVTYFSALQCVSGNVGHNVSAGSGKTIVWDFKNENDIRPFNLSDVRLKIFADRPGVQETTPIVEHTPAGPRLIGNDRTIVIEAGRYEVYVEPGFMGHVDNFVPIPVMDTTGRWGMIDHTGKEIVPCKYTCLKHANPNIYYAVEPGKQSIYILSNTGKLLGISNNTNLLEADILDGITIMSTDSLLFTRTRGHRSVSTLPQGRIFVARSGEVYKDNKPKVCNVDMQYYPLEYVTLIDSNCVAERFIDLDHPSAEYATIGDTVCNGVYHDLNEILKGCILTDKCHYYIKGYINHFFRLPNGISPYKGDGANAIIDLCQANVVKVINDTTRLVGVFSIYGNEIIPCKWSDICISTQYCQETAGSVIFYLCKNADDTGVIYTETLVNGLECNITPIAYTGGDKVVRFKNPATEKMLSSQIGDLIIDKDHSEADVIFLINEKNGLYYLINSNGKLLAKDAERVEALAPFMLAYTMPGDTFWRFVDVMNAEEINALKGCMPHGYVPPFKYCVSKHGNTYIYDTLKDCFVYEAIGFEPINEYSDNRILLKDDNGNITLADSTLSTVAHLNTRAVDAHNFHYGYCFIETEDGKRIIIDEKGVNCSETPTHNQNTVISDFSGDRCLMKKNGRFGYINPSGNTIIPFIYKDAEDFIYERAVVSDDGYHWGVIDKTGAIVYPCVYTSKNLAHHRALL